MRLNKTILFILVLMISAMGLFAGEINFSNNQLNFRTGSFELAETTINGETFTTIVTEDGVKTNEKGFAALPYFHASVMLADKNISLDIVSDSYTDYQLQYPMLPSRGTIYRNVDPATVPYEIAEESLNNEFYPKNITELTEPFIFSSTVNSPSSCLKSTEYLSFGYLYLNILAVNLPSSLLNIL